MSDFVPCIACQAPVLVGATECVGCGAAQTPAAAEAVLATQQATRTRELWTSLVLFTGIAAFALGGGFGFWLRGLDAPRAEAAATTAAPLTPEDINDGFLRLTNRAFADKGAPINLVSWQPGPEGAVIFEMAPPTAQAPAVLWQALAKSSEREAMMAFLAVSYTKALLATGQTIDFHAQGHPVVVLRYAGTTQPVAARLKDGSIRIFPSPFDRPGTSRP